MKRIRFLRHAESMANAGHATEDPASIRLSAKGVLDAGLAAEAYSGPEPEVIVVSPYLRAKMTAEPFRAKFPRARCELGLAVQEFTYLSPARCAMTTEKERRPLVESYWRQADAEAVDGPGAESFSAFLLRVISSIELLQTWDAEVLVVGHGLFIGAAQMIFREDGARVRSLSMADFHRHVRSNPVPNLGLWDVPSSLQPD